MDFVNKGLKSLSKAIGLKDDNYLLVLIVIAALVVLGYLFMSYNNMKGLNLFSENLSNSNEESQPQQQVGVEPSKGLGQNETFAKVDAPSSGMPGLPQACNVNQNINPTELLPKDENSQWAELNPSGNGEFQGVNLLKSGHHMGIDTVGNSLRNANLQVRSEPANPQLSVGPWNNTTISPDTMRVPLEIGQGPQ
tara:strand:+ start:3832 stop:4413 length:582 start_codon:yes stop_codon:yes gene_type:complete